MRQLGWNANSILTYVVTAAKQRLVHGELQQSAVEQQLQFTLMAAWKKKPLIAN